MDEDKKLQKVLAKRIEEVCCAKGLSYYQVDIPTSTLVNVVNNKTQSPRLITIYKLCEGLGISLAEFFDTEEFEELFL